MPVLILILLLPLAAFAQTNASLPAPGTVTYSWGTGPLVWDPPSQYYTAHQGEVGAKITFKVRNTTASNVVIDNISTSCGCTVAPMPANPWNLAPNETNKLDVAVDLRDKTGLLSPAGVYRKDIYVHFADGATNLLSIVITVPGGLTNNLSREEMARLWGQQATAVDHQAVFKNDCVKCHLVPAFGKNGEYLFHTACGICHEAKNRATMVPDLATLKTEIDTNYWRTWVTYGKAGTLMPGFAATEGGPLSDAQINSLIPYLTNAFPRPVKVPPVPPAAPVAPAK